MLVKKLIIDNPSSKKFIQHSYYWCKSKRNKMKKMLVKKE